MLTHLKTFNAGVKWAIKVIHSTVNTYIEEEMLFKGTLSIFFSKT